MHQPQLSGRAKDTVTRRTVMILVSDHTFTPPHRDPICIQPALPAFTSSFLYEQQQHWGAYGRQPQTWPASVCRLDPTTFLSSISSELLQPSSLQTLTALHCCRYFKGSEVCLHISPCSIHSDMKHQELICILHNLWECEVIFVLILLYLLLLQSHIWLF